MVHAESTMTEPKMLKLADWGKEKNSKVAPFTYTGLDFMGPPYVKEIKKKKVSICLFTCLCCAFGNR